MTPSSKIALAQAYREDDRRAATESRRARASADETRTPTAVRPSRRAGLALILRLLPHHA